MAKPRDIGEAIRALRKQGKTYDAIVVALNCSKGTVAYHCGDGVRARTYKRTVDRRAKWRRYIIETKAGKPCMDCGGEFPYYAMDYDHRPGGEKKFQLGNLAAPATLADVQAEIAKCDLVCAVCHRIRTWTRMVKGGGEVPEDFDFSDLEV